MRTITYPVFFGYADNMLAYGVYSAYGAYSAYGKDSHAAADRTYRDVLEFGQQAAPQKLQAPKPYKWTLCQLHANGHCTRMICRYAHGVGDLRRDEAGLKGLLNETLSEVAALRKAAAEESKLLDKRESEVTSLSLEREELQAEVAHLKSDRQHLMEEAATAAQKQQRLKLELGTLKSTVATLESEKSTLESEKSTLEAEKSKLAAQLDEQSKGFYAGCGAVWHLVADLEAEKSTLAAQLDEQSKRTENVVSAGIGTVWQYEVNAKWHSLPSDSNAQLQQYYEEWLNGRKEVFRVRSGAQEYDLNFDAMEQRNTRTLRPRRIRCHFETPDNWERCLDTEAILGLKPKKQVTLELDTVYAELDGVYTECAHHKRGGQPVWWRSDGLCFIYYEKADTKFHLHEVRQVYYKSAVLPAATAGSIDGPWSWNRNWWDWKVRDGFHLSISPPPPPPFLGSVSQHPKGKLCFMDIVVELLDEALLARFTTNLRRSVMHHTDFVGVSDCKTIQRDIKVVRVLRIENWRLWREYVHQRESTKSDLKQHGIQVKPITLLLPLLQWDNIDLDEAVNECILLHGTKWDTALQIAQQGFEPRLAGPGYYGIGTYFTPQACKAAKYTEVSAKRFTMIVSRVVMGDIAYATKVDRKCTIPPLHPNTSRRRDTVVAKPGPMPGHGGKGGIQAHVEVVTFSQFPAYPVYIVQFVL